jgi:hypothetical protein
MRALAGETVTTEVLCIWITLQARGVSKLPRETKENRSSGSYKP